MAQYRLDDIGLGASQARTWTQRGFDDRGLKLGGIFSGLCHVRGDPEDVFYCAADRGPNEELTIGQERRRTFPVPQYNPLIYKLHVEGDRLHIVGQVGIRTHGGRPVSGLSNTEADEPPYGYDGRTRLALDPNGLDVEGLAVVRDGTFWLADEYRPSLVHVAADGTVLTRLIPHGASPSADTRVRAVLPRIYAERRLNRGFEGVALSPDGSRLFAVLESPLEFPDREIGRASRLLRILVVDPDSLIPVAEHVLVAEPAARFGESGQDEMRVSDVACVNRTTLLVVERGQKAAHIYDEHPRHALERSGEYNRSPGGTHSRAAARARDHAGA